MSLGSGRATICGGGSCKRTNRIRDRPKPKAIGSIEPNSRQGTAELTLQSAWYSFWRRFTQPLSAMGKTLGGHAGCGTPKPPKSPRAHLQSGARCRTSALPRRLSSGIGFRGEQFGRADWGFRRIGRRGGWGGGSAAAFPGGRGPGGATAYGGIERERGHRLGILSMVPNLLWDTCGRDVAGQGGRASRRTGRRWVARVFCDGFRSTTTWSFCLASRIHGWY
jgi:hypothetical protein